MTFSMCIVIKCQKINKFLYRLLYVNESERKIEFLVMSTRIIKSKDFFHLINYSIKSKILLK